MSYETTDTTVDDGAPQEFYIFRVENLMFRYTNAPRDIMIGSNPFYSRQITRTALVNNMSVIDNSDTKITLPRADEVCKKCAGLFTPTIIDLDIYQRHRTDPDLELKRIFAGYMIDISTSGVETDMAFTSLMRTHIDAPVATVMYTAQCNHDWGDRRCAVDPEAYVRTSQVIGNDLWTLKVADFIGDDMQQFVGGYIINDRTGIQRNIVNIDNNSIFLDGMFADVEVGDKVRLYPGCDHKIDGDCRLTYNNVINFGGFPFIPRKNPFLKGFGEIDYTFLES